MLKYINAVGYMLSIGILLWLLTGFQVFAVLLKGGLPNSLMVILGVPIAVCHMFIGFFKRNNWITISRICLLLSPILAAYFFFFQVKLSPSFLVFAIIALLCISIALLVVGLFRENRDKVYAFGPLT